MKTEYLILGAALLAYLLARPGRTAAVEIGEITAVRNEDGSVFSTRADSPVTPAIDPFTVSAIPRVKIF